MLLLQHALYDHPDIVAEMLGDPTIFTPAHASEQLVHVLSVEGRLKRQHLVDDAAQGPNIRFVVVWLIAPDFRTGVVRRPSLRVVEALGSCDLGNVHVAEFGHEEVLVFAVLDLHEENIRAFDITVHHRYVVHAFEPIHSLD